MIHDMEGRAVGPVEIWDAYYCTFSLITKPTDLKIGGGREGGGSNLTALGTFLRIDLACGALGDICNSC